MPLERVDPSHLDIAQRHGLLVSNVMHEAPSTTPINRNEGDSCSTHAFRMAPTTLARLELLQKLAVHTHSVVRCRLADSPEEPVNLAATGFQPETLLQLGFQVSKNSKELASRCNLAVCCIVSSKTK